MDQVSPRLRNEARRALRTGDVHLMRAAARTIILELIRLGELMPVEVDDQTQSDPLYYLAKSRSRMLNLSSVGEGLPALPKQISELEPRSTEAGLPPSSAGGFAELFDFNHLLNAMRAAQDLRVGNTNSGEIGIILESIVGLLQKIAPQFELQILLFDEDVLTEPRNGVFNLDSGAPSPAWLSQRPAGHSAFLPAKADLPGNIAAYQKGGPDFSSAVAVPLYEPSGIRDGSDGPHEAGLLFLLGRKNWSQDTALRLGTKLSQFATNRWKIHRELNKKIYVDALTGLFNRGFLDGQLPILVERAKRNQTPMTLIIADIDLFKSINTNYGYVIGDQVLQMVARRLQEEVRRVDVVYRRGGEEFIIILPEAGFDAAREVVTRLLNAPYKLLARHKEQITEISVTLSYGVSIIPENATDHIQLHDQAEEAMTAAKDRGRNRCYYWQNDRDHLLQMPD